MKRHPDPTGAKASSAGLTLAALRIVVSTILVWGALTKFAAGERIEQLAGEWALVGLPEPHLLVTISIGLQLALAMLLFVGLFTRTAGILSGLNLGMSAALSGIFSSGPNWWPFALLVVILLHFGMLGAGPLSIDAEKWRRLAAGREARSLEELLASLGIEPQSPDSNNPGQKGGR